MGHSCSKHSQQKLKSKHLSSSRSPEPDLEASQETLEGNPDVETSLTSMSNVVSLGAHKSEIKDQLDSMGYGSSCESLQSQC